MRRMVSILLLLVLALGPAVPANALASGLAGYLASGWTGNADESRLAACCRRNGKHHCAMNSTAAQGQTAGSSGEPTLAAKDSCPFPPASVASTAPPSAAALAPTKTHSMVSPTVLCVPQGSTSAARMSVRRNWPKRGPPATQIL